MQALTYHGARDVRAESMSGPVLSEVEGVVLRVTARL